MHINLKLVYLRLCFKRSVNRHCLAKVLLAICEISLYENNCNNCKNSYKIVTIRLDLFFSICRNQKKESNFHEVASLVTINISAFRLQRVTLDFTHSTSQTFLIQLTLMKKYPLLQSLVKSHVFDLRGDHSKISSET